MINFLEVEKSVENLKQQLASGQIDEQTFEDQLLGLVDVAEDGYYWMLGHESGRWYRHDGEKWVLDHPGELFAPLADLADTPEQSLTAKWRSVNLGWFIASLILLVLIAGIIYYSTL